MISLQPAAAPAQRQDRAMAQKWADMMTDKYPELAVADPIFGQLQNCMELAVAGAIVVKDDLPQKAGYDLPVLLGSSAVKADVYQRAETSADHRQHSEEGAGADRRRLGRRGDQLLGLSPTRPRPATRWRPSARKRPSIRPRGWWRN